MERRILAGALCAVLSLTLPLLIFADDQKGQSWPANTSRDEDEQQCWSSNLSEDHDKAGECVTTLSCNLTKRKSIYQDAPFPIAGAGGATCRSSSVKSPEKYEPRLYVTERDVQMWGTKRAGAGDAYWAKDKTKDHGSYKAFCHTRKRNEAVKVREEDLEEGETKSRSEGPESDGSVLVEFECEIRNIGGGLFEFVYAVTNHTDQDLNFEWPAMRTSNHPTGWTDLVSGNSSVTCTVVSEAPAVLVPGRLTDLVISGTSDAICGHSSSAWCPESELSFPDPAADLTADYDGTVGAVELAWSLSESYDAVQIIRTTDDQDDEGRAWFLDGDEESFVDDDPPSGDVTYEVIGVVAELGAASSPTVEVSIP